MAPTAPTPSTFTLRFKNHKNTTILHADPLQSFDSLKVELLHALQDTHPDGVLDGQPLPADSSQIFLARPNDLHNPEKGFTSVTDKSGTIITGSDGAGRKRKPGEPELKLHEANPKAAGLASGSVVAFKFHTEEEEDYDPVTDEQWDVVLPKYDDQE